MSKASRKVKKQEVKSCVSTIVRKGIKYDAKKHGREN